MTKAEIIAALWMIKHDISHLKTLPDYIAQFDEIVRQAESLIQNRNQSDFDVK